MTIQDQVDLGKLHLKEEGNLLNGTADDPHRGQPRWAELHPMEEDGKVFCRGP